MAKKRADYDPFEQAKPRNKEFPDFGTGRIRTVGVQYTTRKEFIELQAELEEKINKQTDVLVKALVELQQIKLHVAALSGEPIDAEDVEGA